MGSSVTTRHFGAGLFSFLNELESNNERSWWEQNKDRYQTQVRDPALKFIADFAPQLRRISPRFVADARQSGGSLMRPYRDTRFSPDKTPYKTNVGIQFRHEAGKDIHAPGFYLHFEPGACFAGVGMWHPETSVTRQIRQAIHDDVGGWEKASKRSAFTDVWSISPDDEDMLVRVPRDLDPGHPYPDDLRMKSFVAGARLTQKQVTSPGFAEDLGTMYVSAGPFASFLCDAIGVPF
jgi:uncharacterized protein (TIGR02453 family)